MISKLRRGDTVSVIAGKDKGTIGKIIRVLPSQNRCVVEGVAMREHYIKRNPQTGEQGGRTKKPSAIDISNVMLYDTQNKCKVRVGIQVLESGKRVRINKRTQKQVDENV